MKKLLLLGLIIAFITPVFGQNNGIVKLPPASKTGLQLIKQANINNATSKIPLNNKAPKSSKKTLSASEQFVLDLKKNKTTTPHNDPRNLPLSKNGKLLSVDGYEVDFLLPSDPNISNVCGTKRPYVNGESKDIGCNYSVPCDNPANRDAADYTTIKYFQLEWHVMLDGGASTNIDQTRIDALMAELNADFAPRNMIFCADPATFTEDAVNWDHNSNTEEFSLKAAYVTNPTQVINIYVVGTMTAGGYARFPTDPNGGTSPNGGVVLNRGNCWIGSHTLAHEVGHTFGLEHTFAGVDERADCSNCYEKVRNVNGSSNTTGVGTPLGGPYSDEGDREGDWCSDTNPHNTNSGVCATSGDANNACDSNPWNNAPVNNHMSYSFCSSQFTDQQGRRMHCMVDSYLGSWTAYGGGICGSQPPVADFVGTPQTWQAPSVVNYTDLSLPSALVTGWTWTFDVGASNSVTCAGCTGTNATFVGQTPPAVTYPNPGLYTVTLDITSANGPSTETKVDYIEVLAPAGDCDTLTTQWETPAPTIITYGFGGGWIAGVPDPANMVLPTDPKGIYEGYFSPNPGTTPVGAVRVGLGSLYDPNDDMRFQVVIYDDDGFGAPGAVVGGVGGISPTDLGIPGSGFYQEVWVPFLNAPVPTTGFFHVGVEIFAGDAADTLIVMTSCLGPAGCPVAQGENDASNTIFTSGFGYENLLNVYGADFDVDLIPMLGEYNPEPVVEFFTETVNCDTTLVTVFDTAFYSTPTGWTVTSAKKGVIYSGATDPETIDLTYYTPGPDTITFSAINDCGREGINTYIIPYNFLSTPDAEFVKDLADPICAGTVTTFTANTAGYGEYIWDFGDGTAPFSSGTSPTATHTYVTPGLYYSSLNVTTTSLQPTDSFYFEDFESGFPAGYQRFNNDAFTPDPGVNPPFTGTNATAWLDGDFDGNGNTEAVSTSWNGPGQQADDWMLTSAIGVLPANQILSWKAEASDVNFPDGYEVRISTTQLPANTANYSTLLFSTAFENSFPTTRSVNLAAYAGQTVYIAFRNNSTDQNLLYIDDILVGTAGTGCSANLTKTDFVEVVDCSTIPPTAVLNASTTSGCAALSVTFTDATVAGDPATSWSWNFGDGSFSTLQNPPAHVYATAGTYFVQFDACNTGGCTTDFETIVVSGPPEDASYGFSTTTQCVTGTDITATVTGTAGGAFTATPAGIVINASTGAIDVSASTPNTYSVTYTTSTGPCAATSSINVTINAIDDASYSYSAASYCANDTDPTPTITGLAGGGFTSAPAGLSINAGTGAIDVSTSTPGAYTVTYTTVGSCPNTSDVSVTINALDDASYSYSAATYCVDAADPTPTITGLAGGGFTSAPAGLSINAGTGAIDVSTSTPGAYTVTYTTVGSCPNTANVAVTINALDDASYSYSAASYCANDTDPTPTITGLAGGGFTSSPAGLSINAGTGAIDVSASTLNTYTVTYTTVGSCPNTSNVSVTINALDDASYSYSAATYCVDAADPTPTITGLAGGGFTSSPAGLSINAGSGAIDLSASTPGAYTVTYTTAGSCPNTANVAVTINALDDASYSYSAATYCVDAADPTPTITGLAGGGFTSTPAGLSINAGSGAIDVSASTPGAYTVTYTTAGSCPNTANVAVTINALDDASYSYSAASYCVDAADPTPTITGLTGGGFTSAPAGLSINAGTGAIDVSASTPNTYTVTYTTVGSCPNTANVSVTINALDDASYSYSAASYCANDTDPTPTITGLAGGGFTSSPAGLSINAGSGAIDVSASTPGAYTVTYTTIGSCPNTSNVSVTINALDDATFSYASGTYCVSGTDPTPTITGLAGGAFTFSGGALVIDGNSGLIDLSASGTGNFIVTYTTSGSCPNSSTFNLNITTAPDATFSYTGTPYCNTGTATVTFGAGASGGTFSSTAGLVINLTSGEIDLASSTPNTYTVSNDIAAAGGCSAANATTSVTINAVDDASYSYSAATYCVDAADPTPTITGLAGGGFTSSPASLSINAGSGAIDLSASTPGAYTVTYTTAGSCPNTANVAVTINALDDASYSYSAASYCANDTDPTPTITGLAGGGFTSSPAGLSINAGTGAIDVSASTPNTYTVTYTTVGSCPNTSNVSVTINALDDAAFSYATGTYCVSSTDPTPTITGLGSGTFTADNGLTINPSTGEIDLDSPGVGNYIVTYTTSGTCPNSSTFNVSITTSPDATFSYTGTPYCNTGTATVTFVAGASGGTFSSTAGLVINLTSGEIDLASSTPNTYTVSNDIAAAGGCSAANATTSVTINAVDDASYSYSAATYCIDAADPTPTITGLAGGGFTSAPAGLSINAGSGAIDLSASTPGAYTVTYTTVGSCPNTSDVSVTINALDDASYSYSAATYCVDAADPIPTITGLAGGGFTSSPAGLSINAGSGAIDVSASTPNTYTVTYTTGGSCPNLTNITVTITASPSITNPGNQTACDSYTLPAISGSNLSGTEAYYNNSQLLGGTVITGPLTSSQTVFIYDANGSCSSEESFDITIDQLPSTSDAGTDITICDTITSIQLDGNIPTNGNGMWSVVAGSGIFNDDMDGQTIVSDFNLGLNEYMWMITNGSCVGSMDHVVLLVEECTTGITVPTAFTPDDGDNTNSTWEITGIASYPECEVMVFDKWGSEVFTSKGYIDAWDGSHNGSPLPVGAYYYIIKLNDGSEPLKGNVTIIK